MLGSAGALDAQGFARALTTELDSFPWRFILAASMSNAGPFVSSSLNESFLLLLTFMISVSVPSLALSAEVAVRRRHEEHVNFVMRELSHRSKNLLSIVQSMAKQVARQTDNFDDFYEGFSSRLCAFAETHDLLVMGDWHGADIRDLIRTHLAPFHNVGNNSVVIEGPKLKLNPKAAEQIGLALHELGTNAVKHGALSEGWTRLFEQLFRVDKWSAAGSAEQVLNCPT